MEINLNKSQIYINKESTYNINEGNNLQNLEVNALLKRDWELGGGGKYREEKWRIT